MPKTSGLKNRKYILILIGPGIRIKDISLEHPGMVNVENAVAACSMASLLRIDAHDSIRNAMADFSGFSDGLNTR